MTDDSSQKSYAEIEAERFRKELPGTIGCVTAYAFFIDRLLRFRAVSLWTGCCGFPRASLRWVYLAFGQGSILEMGVMAVILLILSCLCGKIVRDIEKPSDTMPDLVQNGG